MDLTKQNIIVLDYGTGLCTIYRITADEITVDGAEDFLLDKGYSLENIEYMITEEEVCYDQ